MHRRTYDVICFIAMMFMSLSFASFAQAQETQPGDACTAADIHRYRHVGGPENPGTGYMLVCNGSTWKTISKWESATGDTLFQVGYDGGSCDANKEGRIRYDSSGDLWEYCDGSIWGPFEQAGSGGCTPDPACPNVGDVCSGDGSGGGNPKFAGCITYYDANSADVGVTKAIYVTQANQSTASQWKNATGTDDIVPESTEDGKINSANRGGLLSDFPAFELCENLTDGGYTDWYLPARTELDLLWRNATTITGFTTRDYWSSTEYATNYAWYQYFGIGSQNTNTKSNNYDVRCVRRD